MHNMSFVYALSLFQQNQSLKVPGRWILLLDYSNQGWWGMLASLKGCSFEHTELPIHFESFNDEWAIVKEAMDTNLLSQDSKLMRVNLQLNLRPSKSATPVLKLILFQYLKVNLQPWIFYDTLLSGHTMICNNNYLADILRVSEIKDLIWVMRFQSP